VILRHHRRELIHIGVTDQPTAAWAAQQIVHAFPDETRPAHLLRDRDAIYGADFQRRVERLGISPGRHRTSRAPGRIPSPSASSVRFAANYLDLVVVLSERHLRRMLRMYLVYYNDAASPGSR
jgi:hypothetical protein